MWEYNGSVESSVLQATHMTESTDRSVKWTAFDKKSTTLDGLESQEL